MAQVKEFKTEVRQLLNLMIHSLYSNRDIFLRELIANAADAIDKARFESLTDQSLARDWAINLSIDKEKKVFTISDNGIGMTAEELDRYICQIALSGALEFVEKYEGDNPSSGIIGHFGLGFYSSFMVSDTVDVIFSEESDPLYAARSKRKTMLYEKYEVDNGNDN